MQTLAVVPDELWIMMLTIIAFWFGGRFIKRDLGKPRVSKQQLELARESVARRTRVTEGPSRWRRKPGCYRPCRFIGRPTIR
jgi:hypothetical protein